MSGVCIIEEEINLNSGFARTKLLVLNYNTEVSLTLESFDCINHAT